jgi:hypothetical protein
MEVPSISLPLTTLLLASLGSMSPCFAGPPALSGLQAKWAAAAKPEFTASLRPQGASLRPQGGARGFGGHAPKVLDLRPPDLQKLGDDFHAGAAQSEDKTTATLAGISMAKPMSSAEAFTRRVHQEGLPVARLFETKSALVSVGLNQKGKPGLWLIQKTH